MNKILEKIIVIIAIILLIGWLYITIKVSFAPSTGDRSPADCFTAAGDSC